MLLSETFLPPKVTNLLKTKFTILLKILATIVDIRIFIASEVLSTIKTLLNNAKIPISTIPAINPANIKLIIPDSNTFKTLKASAKERK